MILLVFEKMHSSLMSLMTDKWNSITANKKAYFQSQTRKDCANIVDKGCL